MEFEELNGQELPTIILRMRMKTKKKHSLSFSRCRIVWREELSDQRGSKNIEVKELTDIALRKVTAIRKKIKLL
jgi:hypothetical protein